uniref:Reverse transcriptase domain-containing protein n=1 Tax=Kryptolebias marmoratus TaxID=37003 RepID=A0A3Q3BE22_KRYMA
MTKNLKDPKKFWKTVKSATEQEPLSDFPNFVWNKSKIVSDKLKILNSFNEHFISVGSLFDNLNSSDPNVNTDELFFNNDRNVTTFNFYPICITEVLKELKSIDTKKSAGPDNLDPFFLKLAAEFIAEPLAHIFNLSLISNKIPSVWKSAFVLPLFKSGEPSQVNNYRPISKLCIPAKIFEKLVADQLKIFLESNCILQTVQSGFRKKHSTVTATLKVINDLIQALDNKKHCVALFIDLSKAFDTVNHKLLIDILHRIGLSQQATMWVTDYLSNRTQRVQLAGLTSSNCTVLNGVPQGSVLGPLLFSIYINNLCENLSNASYHFYADDLVIYCCSSSIVQAIQYLQSAFNVVQARLQTLKLVLNVDKTKAMIFSHSRTLSQIHPLLTTAIGTQIEFVSNYKYLGFILDKELSFKNHIANLL